MGTKKDLTSKECTIIEKLKNEGHGPRHIGRTIGRSHSCVSRYLLRPAGTERNCRKGHSCKVSEQTRRAIIRSASNKMISCEEIRNENNLSIFRRTVSRTLSSCPDLKYKKKLCRTPLTAQHRDARISWSKAHLHWLQEWYQVIFSKEV
jgi:IS30 family transposase